MKPVPSPQLPSVLTAKAGEEDEEEEMLVLVEGTEAVLVLGRQVRLYRIEIFLGKTYASWQFEKLSSDTTTRRMQLLDNMAAAACQSRNKEKRLNANTQTVDGPTRNREVVGKEEKDDIRDLEQPSLLETPSLFFNLC